MAARFPQVSFIGAPVPIPCAGHAGLGFRQATPRDRRAIVRHFQHLGPVDLRLRFCATMTDAALEEHVAGLWTDRSLVIAALDGPLWSGPFHRAGPVRALAELATTGAEAEIGLSVDTVLRRRGVGTYLVQTAAWLLAPRGVRLIRAYTMPDNEGFIALARRADAAITTSHDEVEAVFDVPALQRAYLRRRVAQGFCAAA